MYGLGVAGERLNEAQAFPEDKTQTVNIRLFVVWSIASNLRSHVSLCTDLTGKIVAAHLRPLTITQIFAQSEATLSTVQSRRA
jgi:hypothetical protein